MALIDVPVLNSACMCKLPICMLYSAWKPSMKTSLIIALLDVTSQADESSESSTIMLSTPKKNLLNSSLPSSSEGVLKSYVESFIKLHCFSLVVLYFGWGNLA